MSVASGSVLEKALALAVASARAPKPIYINSQARMITRRGILWLGQSCNLRCHFCYFLDRIEDENHAEHAFMSLKKAKEICRTLVDHYGNNSIDIQGGEPTLWPHIYDLVSFCAEIGLSPTIISNLQVLSNRTKVARFRTVGLRDVLVSVQGLGEVYDELVSQQGAHLRQMKALRHLQEQGIPFRFLNVFMSAMTGVVIKNGGVVDKIVGDSIMAFWGAPARVENPARLAIDCGLEMLNQLRRLRERDSRFADFEMGVGIATGEAVVGNLGGEARFDYSVVGDIVNLAARLESLTRQLKVPLLVNEQSYREAEGHYVARDLGLIRVKGKTQPAAIWEIVGRESDLIDHSYYTSFSEALGAARDARRAAALEQLQQLAKIKPEDVAVNLYLTLIISRENLVLEDLVLEFSTK